MAKGRRQRGSIVAKGGFYFAVFRDRQGKQKWVGEKPKRGFKTHAEARRRLNEILVELDRGVYVKPKAGTFAEFAEQWLAGRLGIEGGTMSAYRSIIRRHLVPCLGEMQVEEIEEPHYQALATALTKKVRTSKHVHNIMSLLNTMLAGKFGQSALKQGYIRHNPAKGIELPKQDKKEVIPPTPQQVSQLMTAAQEIGGVRPGMILVESSTGVRRGEFLALQYGDIDWFNSEIRIRRAIKKAEATDGVHKWQWTLGAPKSVKSHRRIAMTSTVRSFLAGLKEVSGAGDNDFIFPRGLVGLEPADAWMDPDYFDNSVFAPIAAQAGLSGMRFHDLRHFFASMLIAQGESAKYIQDQMGHSSIQVTFDTYGHLFPQSKRDAADKLDAALATAFSNKTSGPQPNDLLETKRAKGPRPNEVLETLLETGDAEGSDGTYKRPELEVNRLGIKGIRDQRNLVAGGGFEPPTFGL
jgi:integrase